MRLFLWIAVLLTFGCATKTAVVSEPEVIVLKDKGTELYVWEPPIVDVIEVPAGLDPSGVYYRPQHQQVVEIKQGRWILKQ